MEHHTPVTAPALEQDASIPETVVQIAKMVQNGAIYVLITNVRLV